MQGDHAKRLFGKEKISTPAPAIPADEATEPESDSAGRYAKHSSFGVRLKLGDGQAAPLYGSFAGSPWMNPEATVIEIPFSGRVRHKGEWQEGDWTAIITGKRLESIYDHITDGRRLSVKPSGKVSTAEADKPEVSSVVIVPYPPESDDD